MQGKAPFTDWLSDPRNQHIAKLVWEIKDCEAQINLMLTPNPEQNINQTLANQLEYCISLYQKLTHFYPPVETRPTTDFNQGHKITDTIQHWQQHSHQFRQSTNGDDKARHIAISIDCLKQLMMLQQQSCPSLCTPNNDYHLSFDQLSKWFLNFIDLVRHQNDDPSWANDFFQKLGTNTFQETYRILTHADTAHFMFHIYYYKLFPNQLLFHSGHPDFLISLDKRLSFLYQKIEQFIQTFTEYSKSMNLTTPKDFLCHGNQLPKGITLRSKEAYRQLIIEGLKKLNRKVTITEQAPTAEIIDTIFRAYQFWFNPSRLLDAVFMLCKQINLSFEQPNESALFNHMVNSFKTLETEACIYLYGYFGNNDTKYLLRILHYIKLGGNLAKLPVITDKQRQLIDFLYHALTQVIDALSEALNHKQIPCDPISVSQSSKPPSPSKRNLQAILHVIATYTDTKFSPSSLESLFAELEKDLEIPNKQYVSDMETG